MFFPFLDYVTVSFDLSSSGDSLVYTTGYKCLVCVEITSSVDFDGIFESIRVYAEPSNYSGIKISLWFFNGSIADNDEDGINNAILPSGTPIRVDRNNESVGGLLHIFRLPSSP